MSGGDDSSERVPASLDLHFLKEREMKRTVPMVLILGLFLFAGVAKADWTPTQRLTWNSSSSLYPAIAVDPSGHVHVVWSDFTPGNWEIYYKKSTDGGSTWMTGQRLTWNSGNSQFPAVAIDSSGHVHVVWNDDSSGNSEIYYMKSTNGGASWLPSQRLTLTSGYSDDPAIAVDSSGNVHVVWDDDTPGNFEIYYMKSTNGGASWLPSQRLTWNNGSSINTAIAVDTFGRVYVVWPDFTPGNYEIYYRKSTNWGASWLPSQRLTWNSGISAWPAIAVDSSGNIHAVWRDDTPGNYEIYYRKSTNGGASWLPSQRLTWNSSLSDSPAITVDSSGNIHVTWDDDTPGNYEIYYRKYVK
jgi:hypothetical protein